MNSGMHGSSAIRKARIRDRVSEQEWQARVELAAAYRLADVYGMTELMGNHITSGVPGEEGHFLINPYGMLFEEITASSLIKVDMNGDIVLSAGEYGVNKAGFVIHSAVRAAREDAFCIAHTHTPAGMAVSAMECGLLPISQTAMRFLHIAYHDFDGLAEDDDIGARIVADLGHHNAMIMRNHGLLVCGSSVGDAFHALWRLERSCQTQVMAMSCGTQLRVPEHDICESVYQKIQRSSANAQAGGAGYVSPWPAMLRKLEKIDPSYKE